MFQTQNFEINISFHFSSNIQGKNTAAIEIQFAILVCQGSWEPIRAVFFSFANSICAHLIHQAAIMNAKRWTSLPQLQHIQHFAID